MAKSFRLAEGGAIDRARPLAFTFNGHHYEGYAGDTLASALLANGVRMVARSMKYHRPRGIMTSGAAEPSAMVTIGSGAHTTPNLKATEVELYDGLEARSQNVWPSLGLDFGATASLGAKLLPAGFYYKTFMPTQAFWMKIAEPVIRRAAGFGKAPRAADPDHYDHRHAHCDVLVIGAGPAGLMAALAAGRTGARVILADQQAEPGGALLASDPKIGGHKALDWVRSVVDGLVRMPEVIRLPRTTVAGLYDQGYAIAVERAGEPPAAGNHASPPRERVWHIRARQIVLATGAEERPLIFPDNDRPGVMLASAARWYFERHAVLAGHAPVIFTNGDGAYQTAFAYAHAGAAPKAIVDLRAKVGEELASEAETQGIPVYAGASIVSVKGRRRVTGVTVMAVTPGGKGVVGPRTAIACDAILMAGGWSPVLHLYAHAQGRLAWDEAGACFRPAGAPDTIAVAGSASGTLSLAACLTAGSTAGAGAAHAAGFGDGKAADPPAVSEPRSAAAPAPIAIAPATRRPERSKGKQFIDFQNDTTVADILLANREGFSSIEHMKRYTLTGFGTDQGKLGNVNSIAVLAAATGRSIAETGHTTFRPPYTPITFGALAGFERGDQLDPIRVTPIHDWHAANGARFEDVGQWKRPWYFASEGEDFRAAVQRECRAVRNAVGMLDASTLGKIDVHGPDAGDIPAMRALSLYREAHD